ncbi:MAG TPA: STAS domain-containing protein [Acidimicrobiales bacterium]
MADPAELLAVATRQEEDRAVLVLDGEFDMHTAPTVADSITEALATGPSAVEVDTADISFIDSAGLVTLLIGQRRARAAGAELYVSRPSKPFDRVLKMTGLEDLLAHRA